MSYDYLENHNYADNLQNYLINDLANIIFKYLQLLNYENISDFLNDKNYYIKSWNDNYSFNLNRLDYYDINLDHSIKNADLKVNINTIKNIYYYDDESMDHEYNYENYYNIKNITIFGLLTNNLYFLIRSTDNKIIQKNDIIDRYNDDIFISANIQNIFNLLKCCCMFDSFKTEQKL